MVPTLESLAGFIVGAGVTLLIAFLYFKKGEKERRFDERYEQVNAKAIKLSWVTTLIVLLIMWLGVLIYEGAKIAFLLSVSAYGVLLISYGAALFFYNRKV
ncbi:DUF3796 domain-containing protein [Sporosarcina oncorhynchi]|uniref:DUF3796 domain-containing protein n=1 Tax=Sporosarcina oncorhynchi TaxID=3056444 RepID=A0ABZ0L1S0_9BACL|nr:DUF3796 domain-containing protein [Sporosarcina sp. T2O-4]WOV86575.1 DUF3796 domain-containing protein [Sporosarcina sp. T2O-4]